MRHGVFSGFECAYRASMLFANLRTNASGRLVKTTAYDDLDPSEKGAVSYFIGLSVAKVFADVKLQVPWLMHFDIYKDYLQPIAFAGSGGSRPDLVGRDANGDWIAMEAKGRTNAPTDADMINAKVQATGLGLINGSAPVLCVASIASFRRGEMRLDVTDPPTEPGDEVSLQMTTSDLMELYYTPLRGLVDHESARSIRVHGRSFKAMDYPEADLSVGLSTELIGPSPAPAASWPSVADGSSYLGSDGVLITLGRSWSNASMELEPDLRELPST